MKLLIVNVHLCQIRVSKSGFHSHSHSLILFTHLSVHPPKLKFLYKTNCPNNITGNWQNYKLNKLKTWVYIYYLIKLSNSYIQFLMPLLALCWSLELCFSVLEKLCCCHACLFFTLLLQNILGLYLQSDLHPQD